MVYTFHLRKIGYLVGYTTRIRSGATFDWSIGTLPLIGAVCTWLLLKGKGKPVFDIIFSMGAAEPQRRASRPSFSLKETAATFTSNNLFECNAETLGHDQQAIEDTIDVIHRIPKNLNKDHIEGVVQFFDLMSNSTAIGDGAFSSLGGT